MEIYGFKLIVSSIGTPDFSRLEINEQATVETVTLCHKRINEAIRTVLHMGAANEWFVFAGVMASFYALSLVGSYFDFLTICYIGILGGLTLPLAYVKNEEKINEYAEKLKIKSESHRSSRFLPRLLVVD